MRGESNGCVKSSLGIQIVFRMPSPKINYLLLSEIQYYNNVHV